MCFFTFIFQITSHFVLVNKKANRLNTIICKRLAMYIYEKRQIDFLLSICLNMFNI